MQGIEAKKSTILLASLGSIIEYYDFVVYGMLAKYLKLIFFPSHDETVSALQFFSVFAIGYIARPLGGIIAGIVGDRFGRRPAFLYLTLIMAISTITIGLLPDYTKIGFVAPVLLVLCRLGQGLSFGGELPGAATIVAELSHSQRRGYQISFVVASTSIGALAASLVLFCLTSYLAESEIITWGWRIPFIIGGVFGIILFLARQNISETTVFKAEKIDPKTHNPFKQLISNSTSILIGIMLTIFISAMVIGNLYFPFYVNKYYNFPEKNIYLAATLSLIFSAFILPVTGRLSDKYSRISLLKWSTFSYLALSIFIFKLLSYNNNYLLISFMIIHQSFIALASSCYYPIIISLFPVNIRYTGIGLCYNLTYAMMGTLPTILTVLLNKFETALVMPIILSGFALISFLSVCFVEGIEKRNKKIGL
jgi:MFS family permease